MFKRILLCTALGLAVLLPAPTAHAALVAWWKFDESGGVSAADASGSAGATAATLQGGATFQPAAGRFGGAVYLDGASGQINAGDRADLEFSASQSFTLAVWFKSDGDEFTTSEYFNINQGLITKGYNTSTYDAAGYYQLQINCVTNSTATNSFVTFDSRESSAATTAFRFPGAFTNPDVVNNQWHHAVVVVDRANSLVTIYMDGAFYASKAIVAGLGGGQWAMGANTSPLIIGNHFGRFTKGWFDDCGIWDEALTAAQIAQMYTNGISSPDTDGDGLPDSWELYYFGNLDQTATGDPDGDGLNNLTEFNARTNPNDPDTDHDGVNDGAEINTYGSNPLVADTDGDTWPDGMEVAAGTSPTNPASRPYPYNYVQLANLHINEFVSENLPRANDPTAPVDMDGEYPDWIEIRNNEAIQVNLAGYSLSDDTNQLAKWTFARTIVPPSDQVVVFASGKNRAINDVQPHTNFKLKSPGQLFLSRPNTNGGMIVVQAISYDNQRQGVSYGSLDNSPTGALVYFTRPTPGTANDPTSAVTNFVKDTKFDVDRGLYFAPITVNITCATPGATLAYTVNGSAPSLTNGVQVPAADGLTSPTATVAIARTTLLRARAWKTGMGPSDIDTQSYLFPSEVMTQNGPPASMNLSPADTLAWGATGGDLANISAFAGLTFWGVNLAIATDDDLNNRFTTNDLLRVPVVSVVMDWRQLFGPNSAGQTDGGIYPPASGVANEGVDRAASFELINPASDLLNPNQAKGFQTDGNVHIFGGTSQSRWKSYKLSMRFQCAKNVAYPAFGSDGAKSFDNFILDARINNTWMHPQDNNQRNRSDFVNDQVMGDLQNAMSGRGGCHNQPVHVFLNGLYWGLYSLHEKPDHHFAESYYGGDSDDWDVFKHSVSPAFTESDPLVNTRPANPTNAISRANATVVDNFEKLLDLVGVGYVAPNPVPDLTIQTNYEAVATMLDMDDFIDYMILNFLAGNWDWSDKNFYATFYRVGGGKWRFHSWDAEHTFRTGTENFLTGNGNETPRLGQPKGIHNRLKLNAEYRLKFADHLRRHLFNNGVLTVAGMSNAFNFRLVEIDAAVRGESARWGHIRASARTPAAGVPYKRSDWLARVNSLLVSETGTGPSLLQNRWNLLMAPSPAAGSFRTENLYPATAAPDFSHNGGIVPAGLALTMTQTNVGGTIYYTTDVSDPRVYGTGAVSPAGQAYTAPLVINSPTIVKARVLVGTNWSAVTEAVFYPPQDLSWLVVSEIMYNPPGSNTISGDEFEFIELRNAGPAPLSLNGLAFTAGISFAFTNGTQLAPGQNFLLARNPTAFATRYPGVTVNGVYTGRLDNGGETLTLAHLTYGTNLLAFNYNDRNPWPAAADGFGFSIVLNNPAARPDHNDGHNWRASAAAGGSPGASDALPGIPPVLINEVLAASVLPAVDAIELYNPTASAVDLSGWFLTDDAAVPMKYRLPTNSTIPAFGFLVFTETNFNPSPGTNFSFALNSTGDDVYLFSGDAGTNLTGYSFGFDFGASAPGVTFGRYVTSIGDEQYPAQLAPTLGGTNAGPLVGPVVIGEIMYHPPDEGTNDNSRDEFIELVNISGNPLLLYEAAEPTNTWRLTDAVDYSFPTNVTLATGERVLVVNFDPLNDLTNRTRFQQMYGVGAEVRLFGPYGGKLDNSGETIELKRPIQFATNSTDWVLVDKVSYRDQSPWPVGADGLGASLQRVQLSAYGNDPTNWLAAMPTAGNLLAGGAPPAFTLEPVAQTVLEAANVTFTAAATGAGTLTYLWRRDGQVVATNQNGVLTLTGVQPSQAGAYSVVVMGSGGVVVSSNAVLTVLPLPIILAGPMNTNVYFGSNATLTVSASGTGTLNYQWLFNGGDLAGANQASLLLTNVQISHEGEYRVRVSDAVGVRLSGAAWLQPMKRVVFTNTLPVSLTVTAGVDLVFATAMSGYPAQFTNQLVWAGRVIQSYASSNTNVSFTLANVQFTNAGTYQIKVMNLGSPSGVAKLYSVTVNSRPLITNQPVGQVVNPGSNATFSVAAVGTGTLEYQWWRNETNLVAGATGPNLVVTNAVKGLNDGGYTVVVSNAYGVVTSVVATLTVREPAFIAVEPADVAATTGSNAVFTVVAGGGGPYGYRWYFNGTNLAGTNATLTLTNVQTGKVGGYQVVVTNALGAATSRVAQLTVASGDADGDGLPDDWEVQHGLGAGTGNDRDGDPDGDGMTNYQEYLSGTDPQDASSVLKVTMAGSGGSGATVSFLAMPDVSYTVQYRTALVAGAWQSLTNLAARAGTNVVQVSHPAATTNKTTYYRIVTPQQP